MCGEERLTNRQVQEIGHPLRYRILELFTSNPQRSLAARDLATELSVDSEDVSLSQVTYHLRRLQDVGLIPADETR